MSASFSCLCLSPVSGWVWRSLAGSTGRGDLARASTAFRLVAQHLEELLRLWPIRFVRQDGSLRRVVGRVLREFLK